ncbi:MAG: hypothetical protein HYY26_06045 [Acidobacteria bacterium]|nr:hypothetical protein [Acidobacteriota bacterium]
MPIVVWGSGGNAINLGAVESRRCPFCREDLPFNLFLQYRYWGLYWIFNLVTEKNYLLLCDRCGKGWELEKDKVQAALTGDPIPFMHRYGLLLLVGMIVAVIVFFAVTK